MRLVPPHWNTRYLANRAKEVAWRRLHPDAPWLTPGAVRFLDAWLRAGDQGLEWGCGRSTLWFAARGCRLLSIEHDATWAQTVGDALSRKGYEGRVTCRYEEDPDLYATAVLQYPDLSLDFVLVDGVERDRCALGVVEKLRPGGLLIVDNAERYIPRSKPSFSPQARRLDQGYASPTWAHFGGRVGSWRCFWTSSGVTDTALWIKACGDS